MTALASHASKSRHSDRASHLCRSAAVAIAEDTWSPVLSLARRRIRSALAEGLNLTLRQVPSWAYGS